MILSWICGYKIPFVTNPTQFHISSRSFSTAEQCELDKQLSKLYSIGAISTSSYEEGQFISSFFLVPKPDGSQRFILNLKSLNRFLEPPHFKLEDYRTVLKLIYKDCFFTTLDLKDAYFLIPIDSNNRKYLKFTYNGNFYHFNCIPFGLCTAPYVFTKIMKPVLKCLRLKGITCVAYLDDILIISKDQREGEKDVATALELLLYLGFIINYDKSSLIPTQKCKYLGFLFDSVKMLLSLPQSKVDRIVTHISHLQSKSSCKILDFAKLIGKFVAACPAVPYGRVYLKLMERVKFLALRSQKNYNKTMSIPSFIKHDLSWWNRSLVLGIGVNISVPPFKLEIFSDASPLAWGAYCNSIRTHGFWSLAEKKYHINILELLAAFNALKAYAKGLSNCNILLRIDNTTAIACINRMGSVKYSRLNKISRMLWQWCENYNIMVTASYINTKANTQADFESRSCDVNTEYELSHRAFHEICNTFGVPEIDLFATQLNAKCGKYLSWKPDPGSLAVDAFTISWNTYFFYAFPPFSLITKCIHKIINDRAQGFLVVPSWKSQPWYPIFCKLLTRKPIIFRPSKDLLFSPFRDPHPLWRSLTLEVGHLSGNLFSTGDILKQVSM